MICIQGIKDLRSMIGDDDLDYFFHGPELIVISKGMTFSFSIFFYLRSRWFWYIFTVKFCHYGVSNRHDQGSLEHACYE